MSRQILLTGILVCSVVSVGWAQPSAGDLEFTLAGTGSSTDDFDNNSFGIDASLGWYLTDNIELAVRQAFSWFDPDIGDDVWFGATRVAADLHIGEEIRPFVGVNYGGIYGDVNDTWFISPEAGVKWYALETTFIFGMAEYQIALENDVDDSFVYTVGIGFNW